MEDTAATSFTSPEPFGRDRSFLRFCSSSSSSSFSFCSRSSCWRLFSKAACSRFCRSRVAGARQRQRPEAETSEDAACTSGVQVQDVRENRFSHRRATHYQSSRPTWELFSRRHPEPRAAQPSIPRHSAWRGGETWTGWWTTLLPSPSWIKWRFGLLASWAMCCSKLMPNLADSSWPPRGRTCCQCHSLSRLCRRCSSCYCRHFCRCCYYFSWHLLLNCPRTLRWVTLRRWAASWQQQCLHPLWLQL
mmetsp:Transcript_40833/g.87684  ORF Transcript_40833/g.87684 Transcript_40833/m.87684 type:complete len:247 (-) Transcript_40833:52-792(-)